MQLKFSVTLCWNLFFVVPGKIDPTIMHKKREAQGLSLLSFSMIALLYYKSCGKYLFASGGMDEVLARLQVRR